ncbi:P-loop containing nucleoside triphosphate hydrolase protein [Ceratobasidium sp. AG-I]|nr:P-loop containing nucleoside triphosphate hydrolase protein [Ceratobasidium sp. AG-I]
MESSEDITETSSGAKSKAKWPPLRETKLGIWTLYSVSPLNSEQTSTVPSFDAIEQIHALWPAIPLVWRFISDAISVGPTMFALYFGSAAASSLVPVFQLRNNTRLLDLIQTALLKNRPTSREDFLISFVSYALLVLFGWTARKVKNRTDMILRQRMALHFQKRLLEVHSQLDLTAANNPDINTKMQSAIAYSSRAWGTMEGIVSVLSIAAGAVGQVSVLSRVFGLHWDVPLFVVMCVAQPLVSSLKMQAYIGMQEFYAMVTNQSWLRMKALFELGTDNSYKKEVLSNNLSEHINSTYEKEMNALGDVSGEKPMVQIWKSESFDMEDQRSVFEPLPLLLFAYRSMRSLDNLSLSSLFLIQQASSSVEYSVLNLVANSSMLSGINRDVLGLYGALDIRPTMIEGDIAYPEEQFADREGMSIEFKSVCFTYPHSERQVINNMSFTIPAGHLCVIVGENGCGKSTTVQLFNRLYDATSGDLLIDGRPIHDFTLGSLRSASSIMYQDYKHLPLTVCFVRFQISSLMLTTLQIRENILLGRPNSLHPEEDVEQAATLGGAYKLIQKLPQKFDTNLQPHNTGYSESRYGVDNAGPFGALIDAQKPTELSGGEWQRLALSRSFMRNSDRVRLLCYDEPSASLDPKAEQEMFERLRELRGKKTMVFVTHRFGHLTRHADLILYIQEGSVAEQGTHKELLALGGQYSKMYNIQAQAFSE